MLYGCQLIGVYAPLTACTKIPRDPSETSSCAKFSMRPKTHSACHARVAIQHLAREELLL